MTIKSGDLIKHRPTGATWQVVTVDHDRGNIGIQAPFRSGRPLLSGISYLRLAECILETSCDPDTEKATVLQGMQGRDDSRTRWCKAEALRRGWRPIELTDVTLVPQIEDVMVDGVKLGTIGKEDTQWLWAPDGGEATIAESRDGALAALMQHANAVRNDTKPVAEETKSRRKRDAVA